MARRFRHVLVLTTLVFSIVSLVTQPASSQQPLPPAARAIHINLGQAAVPLYGPWKFTIGDSPTDALTGRPLWAEPSSTTHIGRLWILRRRRGRLSRFKVRQDSCRVNGERTSGLLGLWVVPDSRRGRHTKPIWFARASEQARTCRTEEL